MDTDNFWKRYIQTFAVALTAIVLVISLTSGEAKSESVTLHEENIGIWNIACDTFDDTKAFYQCHTSMNYYARNETEKQEMGAKKMFIFLGWNGIADGSDGGVMTIGFGSEEWSVQENKKYTLRLSFKKAKRWVEIQVQGHIVDEIHGVIERADPDWKLVQLLMDDRAYRLQIGKKDFGGFLLKGSSKAISRMIELATKFRDKEKSKPKVDQFGIPLDTF